MSPIPNPALPFSRQEPVTLLGMAIWAEARGTTSDARIGVGSVIRNRVGYNGRYGEGFSGVILRPYQFSSFNQGDPNREKMLRPLENQGATARLVWDLCYEIADGIYRGELADNTFSAVFYYSAPLTQPPVHEEKLTWGTTWESAQHGGLAFHRDKPRHTVAYDKILRGTSWYFVPQRVMVASAGR